MSYFVLIGFEGVASSVEETIKSSTAELHWCKAVLTTMIAMIVLAFLWWRSAEAARVHKKLRSSDSKILPTPVPVLPRWLGFLGGHTLRVNIPKLTDQIERWAGEFGGDFELHLFGQRTIALTSVADIRRVLTLRPSKYRRDKQILWAGKEAGVAPSLLFDEGKEWGRSRRLISPHFNGQNVTTLMPSISKVGERLCAKLGWHADSNEVVDAKKIFGRFTHDIIALATIGIDMDSLSATEDQTSPSFRAIQSTLSVLNALVLDLWKMLQWKYLSTFVPWIRRVKEDSRQLEEIVQRAIDVARRDGSDEVVEAGRNDVFPDSLLRKIMARVDRSMLSDRMKISDKEVLHHIKSLFIAGTDTTALALCWAMYYLVKNPAALARCRAEGLKAAPSSRGMVSAPEQLSQLVFCAAVFREVIRLRTAVPIIVHNCLEDHTMKNGYTMKKGEVVLSLSRFASTSDENFTRGAEFVPERWIESERNEALLGEGVWDGTERSVRHIDDALLGFGSGPRVCPGKDLARVEAAVVIAAICSRFDISLAPGQPDPPEEVLQFTVGPEAVKLIFKRKEKFATELTG